MTRHIAITCALCLLSFGAFAAPVTPLPIRSMYVLGDSLSDQGNLLAATSALGAPLGQPGIPDPLHYFEGRFSNGGNYVDALIHPFFAHQLAAKHMTTALVKDQLHEHNCRAGPIAAPVFRLNGRTPDKLPVVAKQLAFTRLALSQTGRRHSIVKNFDDGRA